LPKYGDATHADDMNTLACSDHLTVEEKRVLPPSHSEIWLRGNLRAIVVGSLLPAMLGLVGLLAALNLLPVGLTIPLRMAAGILALLAALVGIAMALQARLPRLAYANRELLVYTGPAKPYRVPIEVVEVFFGGQGATDVQVPGYRIESRNLVVRLAERHQEWHERKMRASFGRWQDGYISLNGTWCEPITADLIRSMNHKLAETKRGLSHVASRDRDRTNNVDSGKRSGAVGDGALEKLEE
jgi:hypothetical protein